MPWTCNGWYNRHNGAVTDANNFALAAHNPQTNPEQGPTPPIYPPPTYVDTVQPASSALPPPTYEAATTGSTQTYRNQDPNVQTISAGLPHSYQQGMATSHQVKCIIL